MISENYIDYTLVNKLRKEDLKKYLFIPIIKSNLYTTVAAVSNENNLILEKLLKSPIKYILYDKKYIEYTLRDLETKFNIYNLYKLSVSSDNEEEKSYILDFINEIISFSVYKKSSDIHMETLKNSMIIRYRIDGSLETIFKLRMELFFKISSVVKLLSSLDISQKRIPQDGRFSIKIEKKIFDCRVSVLPTITGESIVIRILDSNSLDQNISLLGFNENNLKSIKESIKDNSKMILVTGPTGSGKTTTLYSILKMINNSSKKIITVEDPVEYNIENIQQVSINNEIGLTFTSVLKNILRQDPDVLMIGEIRDKDSLKIAMQAALTGHLVLATLHTNDAISTISRLINLDAKPYLIASTIKIIISQRLARKLCTECKNKIIIDKEEYYTSVGCSKCNTKGYIGREILSEVLNINRDIAHLISTNESENEILKQACKNGFITMYEDGIAKAKKGSTSLEEVYSLAMNNE